MRLALGRDDLLEVAEVLRGHAGGAHDGVPAVYVLGRIGVAVAGRGAGGEREVGGDLPEGDEGQPEHALEHVLAGRLADPVGLAEDQVRAPPDDRVGRVHHVQHPGAVPGLARRRYGRTRVIREPYDLSVLVDGLDLRAARVAVIAELPEQRVEVGRPGEQDAGGEVGHAVFAAEGGLAAERSQALPGNEQPRALTLRQFRPGAVDRVEERPARLAGLGLVHQVGNPGRQVGVLERHGRRVAVAEVLERVHQRRIDPAAAGRRYHQQVLATETARALEVPHGQGGPGLGVVRRRQPGVDPDRLPGRLTGELLDITHRGALADEVAALPAQRVPRDERARSARTEAGGGLVYPLGGPRVAHRVRA